MLFGLTKNVIKPRYQFRFHAFSCGRFFFLFPTLFYLSLCCFTTASETFSSERGGPLRIEFLALSLEYKTKNPKMIQNIWLQRFEVDKSSEMK
jgi:hypothetical protein